MSLKDAAVDSLIAKNASGYGLPQEWKVAEIDYVYRWWGLGQPVFDAQHITLSGDAYQSVSRTVPTGDVQRLLDSLSHLHPTSTLVGGHSHTDDYPSWYLRLKGTDGREILIMSSSTASSSGAPWTVLENGRLYAHYRDELGQAVFALFASKSGEPAAMMWPGGGAPNTLEFSSVGLPKEMISGFSGLAHLRDGFRYDTYPLSKTIQGLIVGRESIGGTGNMVIGTITNVHQVQIEVAPNQWLGCPLVVQATNDVAGAAWQFTCQVQTAAQDQPFRYPIQVTYKSDAEDVVSTGHLIGKWVNESTTIALEPSEELLHALSASPEAAKLISEHTLGFVESTGAISPAIALTTGDFLGTLTLLGAHSLDGHSVRYALQVPYAIANGRFVHFPLTSSKLQQLLDDVLALPLSKRVLTAAPNTILTLFYDELATQPLPKIDSLLERQFGQLGLQFSRCDGLPGGGVYPTSDTPIRGFGYVEEKQWVRAQPQFILIDRDVAVVDLRLGQIGKSELSGVLLPKGFIAAKLANVRQIMLSRPARYLADGLLISLPEDAGTDVRAEILSGLPELPAWLDTKSYDPLWQANNIAPIVTASGQIDLAPCKVLETQ